MQLVVPYKEINLLHKQCLGDINYLAAIKVGCFFFKVLMTHIAIQNWGLGWFYMQHVNLITFIKFIPSVRKSSS